MKVIDLLNKIAKGEEVPLVIKCEDVEFALEDNEYYYENCENHDCYALFDYFAFEKDKKSYEVLDLEVEEIKEDEDEEPDLFEIIGEKPKHIEELDILLDNESYSNEVLYGKINDLAKAVNYLLDKE